MADEENIHQPLKSFKVKYSFDGIEDETIVESYNRKSLENEFRELKMGKIISAVEVDKNGKPITQDTNLASVHKAESKLEVVENDNSSIKSQPVIERGSNPTSIYSLSPLTMPEIEWKEVQLSSGEVIRVSNMGGEVQEQTWKDVFPDNLLKDAGIRILKNGVPIKEYPKGFAIQKLVWVKKEN